jgi:hypothetical protein
LVLSYQDKYHPDTATILRGGNVNVEGLNAITDAQQQAVVQRLADEQANVAAKGHILLFLGPTQRTQLLSLPGGLEIWENLHEQYTQWEEARAPLLQREYESFRPRGGEGVVAMCNRFDALCLRLDTAGMAPASKAAIQHMVKALKKERPAWSGFLQGLWQVLPDTKTMTKLRAGRVIQDSGVRRLLGGLEADEAEELAPNIFQQNLTPQAYFAATGDLASRDAKIAALEEQLKYLQFQHQRPSASRPRQPQYCHRCGSDQHLVRRCPYPPAGLSSKGAPSAAACVADVVHADIWLLDSGTTHHMSSGGNAGAATFMGYQTFLGPRMVQFGKRGIKAPALGSGSLVLHGSGGLRHCMVFCTSLISQCLCFLYVQQYDLA